MEKRSFQLLTHNLGSSDLTLEAKVNQGFEITEIALYHASAESKVDVIIGDEKMLWLETAPGLAEICPPAQSQVNPNTLLKSLRAVFPQVPTLKVCPGETLTITSVSGTAPVCTIYYRELTNEDVPKVTEDGASQGKIRLFHSLGTVTQAIGAGATVAFEVTTPLNLSGFSKFPFSGTVPVGKRFHLIGAYWYNSGSTGADITYNGLRIWKLEESILSQNELYIPMDSIKAPLVSVPKPVFTLPKPIIFEANETLVTEVSATNAGGGSENAIPFIGYLFLVEEV